MYDIKTIITGYIKADGGAMFGAIPKRAWKRKYTCTDDNLCTLAMRSLLLLSEKRKVLIDLGMGDKHIDKLGYYQPQKLIDFKSSLMEHGVSLSDITDVILTHLHFDHCGFATRKDEYGNCVPSFPNATYWLGRKQWDNFNEPNLLEADSFFADNILPVYEKGLLKLVDDDIQISDGLSLSLYDGHTCGQLVACIKTREGIIAFPGDLIPTSAHVSLDWISAYDVCALTSLTEKLRFLKEAESGNYTLVYCHDAYVISSKVERLNDGFISTQCIKEST